MSSDCACLTDMGNMFRSRVAATENAGSPRIEHRVDGSRSVSNVVVYTPAHQRPWTWTLQGKSVRFQKDIDTRERKG